MRREQFRSEKKGNGAEEETEEMGLLGPSV